MNLLSAPSLVESPFIIAKIGDYTFGAFSSKLSKNRYGNDISVNYPNFMKSISIIKVNGTVNLYTLQLTYQIGYGDDPNLLERVFGTVSNTRRITLTYGDWSTPSFIYKEETALITKVTTNVDFGGSRIDYTLNCVSDSLSLMSTKYDFPRRFAKPSDIIKELLYNHKYGLTEVFSGMTDKKKVLAKNLIASDDKQVEIQAKPMTDVLAYINYLTNCMTSITSDSSSILKDSRYYLTIYDEKGGDLGGSYFKVTKVNARYQSVDSYDTYTIDIGYPGDNFVTAFNIKNTDSWSILYNYSEKISQPQYKYHIDNNGEMEQTYSPSIAVSNSLQQMTEATKQWWTNVTQFPIQVDLTIKGLLRPSILMTYVRLNTYFYGQKHGIIYYYKIG